jgi:hypothetical protein
MNLKRDNWKNQEIIDLLKGNKISLEDNPNFDEEDLVIINNHNFGIDQCIYTFYDFMRNEKEFGAMAYDLETKSLYQIGEIPKD